MLSLVDSVTIFCIKHWLFWLDSSAWTYFYLSCYSACWSITICCFTILVSLAFDTSSLMITCTHAFLLFIVILNQPALLSMLSHIELVSQSSHIRFMLSSQALLLPNTFPLAFLDLLALTCFIAFTFESRNKWDTEGNYNLWKNFTQIS